MHPGSIEYSMLNSRVVNKFLDDASLVLVELFDRQFFMSQGLDLFMKSLQRF
jgi:hypothetical protein